MPMRIFRLDEDKSGKSPNNLIPNESHTLPATGARFLVTKRGPFFSKTVRVVDAANGRVLVPRIDYECIQMEVEQTLASGQEVCSIIIIRNDAVSANVLVTYQAYGGWLSYSVTAVIEMIEALDLDVREIEWGQIVGVPDRLPAAPHRHPLSDVYGWHKLFPGLGAIRDAILVGNQPVLDAIRDNFNLKISQMEADYAALAQLVDTHVRATGNVHGLNIHQIDGWTQAEIQGRLDLKLGKEETAVNSARVYNLNQTQLRDWINNNLNNTLLRTGFFNYANLAPSYQAGVVGQMVTSEGWKSIKQMVQQYIDPARSVGIYYAGAVRATEAMAMYADNDAYPAPCLIGHNYYRQWQVYVGNGEVTQVDKSRGILYKAGPGNWVTFVSY